LRAPVWSVVRWLRSAISQVFASDHRQRRSAAGLSRVQGRQLRGNHAGTQSERVVPTHVGVDPWPRRRVF
jgi:hypothetical protein